MIYMQLAEIVTPAHCFGIAARNIRRGAFLYWASQVAFSARHKDRRVGLRLCHDAFVHYVIPPWSVYTILDQIVCAGTWDTSMPEAGLREGPRESHMTAFSSHSSLAVLFALVGPARCAAAGPFSL